MPEMNGFDVVRRLNAIGVDHRVVFLTVHDDTERLAQSTGLGAIGYVAKPRMANDLTIAAREASQGRRSVSP